MELNCLKFFLNIYGISKFETGNTTPDSQHFFSIQVYGKSEEMSRVAPLYQDI